MSETDALATLTYLQRLDRRQRESGDLLLRQQERIGRPERTMRQGFLSAQRNLFENKGDIALLENRLINRLSAEMELSNPARAPR
jgi:hypothetical protein